MEGSTKAFFDAVYRRDAERVRRLVQTLGPIGDGSDGASAMRISVARGYDEILLTFLRAGASPNVRDGDGTSPLMWVAWTGNTRLAREVCRLGANPNVIDNLGWTALFHASAAQDLGMVKFLLDAGADVTVRDCGGKTAVDIARYRRFTLRLPLLGTGGGQYRTLFDTPVRAVLRAHMARSTAEKSRLDR